MEQDVSAKDFLHYLKAQGSPVTIFLVNGVKLQGFIVGFSSSSVFLEREGYMQLIYQHAISTIMPSRKTSFEEMSKES